MLRGPSFQHLGLDPMVPIIDENMLDAKPRQPIARFLAGIAGVETVEG
jgi:hypothetical protein